MPSCASTGKRSRLSKKTKARVEVGVQPCQEASLEKICHACTKGPNGEEWVKYHDRWFHKPCKRGVEAQHRSLRSADPSGEALNANVSQMLQDPETWRAEKFHYFRPDASNSERMDGHRKMKAEASTYNKSESFQSTFGFQDDVTIRKRHYWKWLCQFESIDEPTALRQFDKFTWYKVTSTISTRRKPSMFHILSKLIGAGKATKRRQERHKLTLAVMRFTEPSRKSVNVRWRERTRMTVLQVSLMRETFRAPSFSRRRRHQLTASRIRQRLSLRRCLQDVLRNGPPR